MNSYNIKTLGVEKRKAYSFYRPDDLASDVIRMMAQVPNLDPSRVNDVICGNAVETEQGMKWRYISLWL
jgi:acetyl-CoA acyltransferase